MANRRMIAKSISVSDETNSISDFAALLFTWLIPHTDDYGVIPGSPGRIKALVVPRRKQTEAEIEAALEEMRAVGLIYRYSENGQQCIQLVHFDKHQEGLHKRTAPRNPLYRAEQDDGASGKLQENPGKSCVTQPNVSEPKPTESKSTHLNSTTEPTSVDGVQREIVEALTQNVCRISSPMEREMLRDWSRTLPDEWILQAIKRAALNKAGSIRYVDTILKTWKAKYKPDEKPWEEERWNKQNGKLSLRSFAMEKLSVMAQEAAEYDTG